MPTLPTTSLLLLLVRRSSIVIACGFAACTAAHHASGSNGLDSDAGEGREGGSTSDAGYSGLSCARRTELASQQLARAIATADTRCETDVDCARVAKATVCTDSCDDVVVSNVGRERIEAALNDVAGGVCAAFSKDGCKLLALPCDASTMTSPVCEQAQCVAREPMPAGSCPDGCTPNTRGSCEGDSSCSGCPAQPLPPTTATCTDSGQRCFYQPACGGAECTCAETAGGALEWSCVVRAC